MQNINKLYARNLATPIDSITKKKEELTKTQAFGKVIEGAANFFKDEMTGKDFVTQSLKLRDGTLKPNEDKPYESLICELGKNKNNYWFTGSKVFPRGFQKTLAIGYIKDNANNSAFIDDKFNFAGFKEWIYKNFNKEYPGVADNLTKKYYEHIKIDKGLNVKFGSTEYTNEIPLTQLLANPSENNQDSNPDKLSGAADNKLEYFSSNNQASENKIVTTPPRQNKKVLNKTNEEIQKQVNTYLERSLLHSDHPQMVTTWNINDDKYQKLNLANLLANQTNVNTISCEETTENLKMLDTMSIKNSLIDDNICAQIVDNAIRVVYNKLFKYVPNREISVQSTGVKSVEISFITENKPTFFAINKDNFPELYDNSGNPLPANFPTICNIIQNNIVSQLQGIANSNSLINLTVNINSGTKLTEEKTWQTQDAKNLRVLKEEVNFRVNDLKNKRVVKS